MTVDSGAATPVFSEVAPELMQSHYEHLTEGSGISPEVVAERQYKSCLGRVELVKLGFTSSQQRVPWLLIPLWSVDGAQAGCQYRPDNPRFNTQGKSIKYESPRGSGNRLDCPPRCQQLLGDPKTPLWITEGSKKADALASHGVCAISITGVWGFKGKNEHGAVTILADWDHIALRGRTVYLTFDSDVVTKPSVKKALERLAEHLRRKSAEVRVIYLPQGGDNKVGIDDYLLEHSIDDALKYSVEIEITIEELKPPEIPVSGFVLRDGTVAEMVVDADGNRSFAMIGGGAVRKTIRYKTEWCVYVPESSPLVGQVVHFAATAVPYKSQSELFHQVKSFVHKYLELPDDFEDIASLYVLLTWVYEFAPAVPYLRVIGDWGSGKTRFLQVVGSVCFRPMFASGATTPAPVFRILEQFKGTLVMDEADFGDSSAWSEMIKVLNNGYRPGMPVLRADKENNTWYPRSYQVFGPKLIATRFRFKDEALESRCLTAEMLPLTRADIPRLLPPTFEDEIKNLRSQLLTFRLANLLRLKGKTFGNEMLEPGLQPRLQEILIPLKAMVNGDGTMAETLCDFIHHLQESLYSRRRESQVGRLLAAMIELHEEGGELSSKNLAERINEMNDESSPITAEKIGWLTRKFGFEKVKDKLTRRITICWDEDRITRLASAYGINDSFPLSQGKPFGPFEPFGGLEELGVEKENTGTEDFPKGFPEVFDPVKKPFGDFEASAKGVKGLKGFLADKGDHREEILGMTVDESLKVWQDRGRPEVILGPGEKCFDLEKLLLYPHVLERHLQAVKAWLDDPETNIGDNHSNGINPMTGR